MKKKIRTLSFFLIGIGMTVLSGCNRPDQITNPGKSPQGTGSARLALPSIPPEFLAGDSSGPGARTLFALTISGIGMAPIQKSWNLVPGPQPSVYVNDIPVGIERRFYGRIIRIDSVEGDTSVAYEGVDSASIDLYKVAEVHLYLQKTGGGSAHICVEVEGWQSDSTCVRPPDVVYPNVSGCWNLSIDDSLTASGKDSVQMAKLHIIQWDDTIIATVTLNSGARDSAVGIVDQGGGIYLGYNGLGQFRLKAHLDSGRQSFNGIFLDSLRSLSGSVRGNAAPCDTATEPPPADTLVRACFSVSQVLTEGKSGKGRLTLETYGEYVWGAFHWNGFASMWVSPDLQQGRLMDTIALDLHARPAAGMLDSAANPDTLSYRIRVLPTGTASGKIYHVVPKDAQAGTWKITRSECTVKDSLP
jgi:hypothetical protein